MYTELDEASPPATLGHWPKASCGARELHHCTTCKCIGRATLPQIHVHLVHYLLSLSLMNNHVQIVEANCRR